MTVLLELLEIGGIPFTPTTGSPVGLPPGAALKVEPLFASEQGFLLSGLAYISRGPIGGTKLTLSPGDSYVCPLEVKLAVEAAFASGTPITLRETLSNPARITAWSAVVLACEFSEAAGTGRAFYNYSITFQGGPLP